MTVLKITLLCLFATFITAAKLPSSIQKCSLSDPKWNQCITHQAKLFKPIMIQGLPEFGIEPMDPLALNDLSSGAGTFTLKSKNVVVKGMKNMEIRELGFDIKKKTGYMKLYGNVTFVSDYETEGRLLLLPFNGKGKLLVKIRGLDVHTTYKMNVVKDANGVEHLESSAQQPVSSYENVKIKMTNILNSGGTLDEAINQVINDNWRELMKDLGPPFVKAVFDKVEVLVNKLYSQIDLKDLTLP